MELEPSFECRVRPDGGRYYVIGHELVDEFLEFVAARSQPNTVRAYRARSVCLLHARAEGPDEGHDERRPRLRRGRAAPASRCGERRSDLRW